MSKSLRILVGVILLVLLTVGALWLSADRLLDGVVRPWLIVRTAAELNAEVGLERLVYADGRLVLTGLTLERSDVFHVTMAAIEVRFSWLGLLQRRVSEVLIRQPLLVWSDATEGGATSGTVAWPSVPPLRIEAWHVENGSAELNWGDRRLLVSQLAAAGGLDLQFPMDISARIGAEPGVAMRLNGRGDWQDGFALTLDEFSWNDQNLLTHPLIIKADAVQSNGVQLGLESLNDTDVAGLLEALGEPLPWPAELHWQLTAPAIELRLTDAHLAVHLQTGPGFLQMLGQSWPWQSIDLQLQGPAEFLELVGTLGLAGSSAISLQGTWSDQQLKGKWDVTVGSLVGLLQSLGITMPASQLAPHELRLHGIIEAGLDMASVSSTRLTTKLGEQAALAGDLHGEWRDKRLSLICENLVITPRNDGGPLAEGTLTLDSNSSSGDWQGEWSLQVADAASMAQVAGFPFGAGAPNLHALTLAGGLEWRDGRLRLPKVAFTGRLSSAQASGRLHGRLNLEYQSSDELVVTLDPLTLEAVEYQAADGMAGLIGGALRIKGRLGLGDDKLAFNLSGQASAAEALLQSWYGNLAALPLHFTARGRWLREKQSLELAAAELDLASLVKGRCSGVSTAGEIQLMAQVDVPRLEGAFEQTLKTLAGELLPGMDRLSLGGRLLLEGDIRAQGDLWALDLDLEPVDMHIAWDQSAQIDGLQGRFPVHLQKGGPAADEPAEVANLQWSGLRGGLITSGAGRLDVQAAPNRWHLLQPLELSAASGVVRVTTLQLDLPNLVPQLRASIDVTNIDLLQFSRFLDWPEMGGLLSASLAEIHIAGDEIRTVGDASMRAFGGAFTIGNMRVEAPFSRFPTYHADVDFSGIDLYQLTNTFAFGEMNGIADGYIHELRLFDGTPSAFKARLETRLEGTRNISVKAIRNLNTLSQGGLSAALSQGVYQFIDFYRYRKIGILCWLQNDHFHLEGSGREDSNQYLVYGGLLPPRIDVVVSSPTISFKEMVRRLKRIERAER